MSCSSKAQKAAKKIDKLRGQAASCDDSRDKQINEMSRRRNIQINETVKRTNKYYNNIERYEHANKENKQHLRYRWRNAFRTRNDDRAGRLP